MENLLQIMYWNNKIHVYNKKHENIICIFFIYNNVINDIIDYTNETENNFYDLFCFFLDPLPPTSSDFSFTFFFLTVVSS